jgi:hypothetical protein
MKVSLNIAVAAGAILFLGCSNPGFSSAYDVQNASAHRLAQADQQQRPSTNTPSNTPSESSGMPGAYDSRKSSNAQETFDNPGSGSSSSSPGMYPSTGDSSGGASSIEGATIAPAPQPHTMSTFNNQSGGEGTANDDETAKLRQEITALQKKIQLLERKIQLLEQQQ